MSLEVLFNVYKDGEPVHLPFVELANIDVAICKFEGAIAIFLSIFEVPLILTAVSPP